VNRSNSKNHLRGRSLIGLLLLIAPEIALSQDAISANSAPQLLSEPSTTQNDTADTLSLNRLITRIVLESVPHSFNDDKDWGKQIRQFKGIQLRREGWKVETKREWNDVNHGVWQRATGQLVEPERLFSVELSNVLPLDATTSQFDLSFRGPLVMELRQAHWVRGVQLHSVSADIKATVRLTLSCAVAADWRLATTAPSVAFRPQIKAADLQIEEFTVQRVSKLGGEFAQQVTKLGQSYLDRHIEEHEKKIVDKLNQQIARRSDKLVISLGDLRDLPWVRTLWPQVGAADDQPANADPVRSR
jgi:hypothetical protein